MTGAVETAAPVRRTWARRLRISAAPDPGRRMFVILLVLGWVLGVAWRFWLTRYTTMPIAHTDEDSYLNAARAIAGGPGGFSSETVFNRRAGYPILISPAYLLGQDFFTTYHVVHLINAMLNAAMLPLAYLLCRRMLALGRVPAFAAAVAAATLPATVFYSGVAMIDSILAPLLIAWLLAVHAWLDGLDRLRLAILAGALAGAFYILHVRGLVIVGIHLALATLLALRKLIPWRAVLATSAPVAALAVVNRVVIDLLGDKVHLLGPSAGMHTIRAIGSPQGMGRVLAATGTQIWYLVVITFGLAGIGWALALREIWRPSRGFAFRWTMGIALTATLGVAFGSSVILAGSIGPSEAIYARYIQMLAPFWLLVGLAALLLATSRVAVRQAAFALAVLIVGGVGVALRLWYVEHGGNRLRYGWFNAPELYVLTAGYREMRPLTGTFLAGGACVVLVLAVRVRSMRLPVIALLVLANLFTMNLIVDRIVRPAIVRTMPTPRLVEDIGVRPGERVAASLGVYFVTRYNLSNEVTWVEVPWFRDVPPADADVVLVRWAPGEPDDWDGAKYGFVRLGGNVSQQWAAWRRIR